MYANKHALTHARVHACICAAAICGMFPVACLPPPSSPQKKARSNVSHVVLTAACDHQIHGSPNVAVGIIEVTGAELYSSPLSEDAWSEVLSPLGICFRNHCKYEDFSMPVRLMCKGCTLFASPIPCGTTVKRMSGALLDPDIAKDVIRACHSSGISSNLEFIFMFCVATIHNGIQENSQWDS